MGSEALSASDSVAQSMRSLIDFFEQKLHLSADECELLFAVCLTACLNGGIELTVRGEQRKIKGWAALRRTLKKYVFVKARGAINRVGIGEGIGIGSWLSLDQTKSTRISVKEDTRYIYD